MEEIFTGFDYIYHNLGAVPDEEIASVENGFLKGLIFVLKYAYDVGWLGEHFAELLQMPPAHASPNALKAFFRYLSQQSKFGRTKIIEVMEALPEEKREPLMSFADYFEEKGLEKGREQGLNEKSRTAAINMIRKGYSDAEICDVLEVTTAYVTSMRMEVSDKH